MVDLESVMHAAVLKAYGPQNVEDLATHSDGCLVPSALFIEADAIWEEAFGDRAFAISSMRRAKKKASERKADSTLHAWQLRHRTAMRFLRKVGVRSGRGGHMAVLGRKTRHFRPEISSPADWIAGQREMVRRYANSKARRDEDIEHRKRTRESVYKHDIKEFDKVGEKIWLAAENVAKGRAFAERNETNVWLTDSLKAEDPSF